MKQSPGSNETALTRSQLLLWTGQELNPDAPLYNMVLTFEIKGAINTDRFDQAFKRLVHQSDAMRTVFLVSNGVPLQQVLEHVEPSLIFLDCTETAHQDGFLKDWIEEHSKQIFNLSNRCFESALIKLADGHFIWYLNQHHLITDAWGVSVQYKALVGIYKALQRGGESSVWDLPKFQDYVAFEKAAHQTPQYKEAKSYWDEKIKNAPPISRLYGYSDQVFITGSERVTLDLGIERSKRLRALAKEPDLRAWTEHLSLFNIFATILFSYLYRVSGQQRLSIGTPAHNRTSNVFKQTPGLFIELYPLFVDVQEDESFSELLSRVRDEVNGYLRYSAPGVTSAKINRTFNAVLNYIHASFEDFEGMPMRSEWIHPGHCDPRHHLRLQVHDFDATGNLQLHFDFNTQVFDGSKRDLAPGHFIRLLDAFLEERKQPIAAPELVSSSEYRWISSNLNPGTTLNYPVNTVLDLFTTQVRMFPEDTALISGDRKETYESLEKKSNQLAQYLCQNGIGPGQRVVLLLNRSVELLIGILGVLKSGAAYVPLDSKFPRERVAFVLNDLDASLILTNSGLESVCGGARRILLDREWDQISVQSEDPLSVTVAPGHLAYIMYTSGTSGQPKGVMIPHQALLNYILWAKNTYLNDQRFTFPLFTMPSFDLTITSIFLPLVSGGKIVIYPEADTGPDLALLQVIDDNLVDVIKLTPAHFGLLNKVPKASGVRKLIVGGEDFKSAQARDAWELFGEDVEIYNEYGPTEATVGCLVHRLTPEDLRSSSIPIGKPITNTSVLLLDSCLNPVPQGVVGELFIAGAGVARGYWNQPALTHDKLIDCPLEPGTRMYRTGDLGRLNQEGSLEYLGRKDRQIKIGGVRIELGEIEATLAGHPAVQQAAVEFRHRGIGAPDDLTYCKQCGLPSNYPSVEFNEEGICDICRSFEHYQQKAHQYFKEEEELKKIFNLAVAEKRGEYDCIMLLSGGKDSTYALARLVDLGYKVLAFTLDNGYISDQAKANIKRVVNALGVDHLFGKTEAMNDIFVDSLNRHSNVCNGCFKTIYTLSTNLAVEKGIPIIVTGLSRGQFFETRLSEELFKDENVDFERIDETILQARKAYHQTEDSVNRLLDVSVFKDEKVFERVRYLDFYRFCDVSLDQMLTYLDQRIPWVRPSDTGRSTNCIINQVGIYVHRKRRGYSNYAFPYSWDVRMGHKTRDASIEEVNEKIDEQEVYRIMDEIGYRSVESDTEMHQLVAYYTSQEPVTMQELRQFMSQHLPDYMIPTHFRKMQEMPLTSNGKIDYRSLPGLAGNQNDRLTTYKAPESQIELILSEIWSEVLQIPKVGVEDNFLHLGGNSLAAIRLNSRINEAFQLDLSLKTIFEFSTIADFSKFIDNTIARLLEEEHSKKSNSL